MKCSWREAWWMWKCPFFLNLLIVLITIKIPTGYFSCGNYENIFKNHFEEQIGEM